MSEKIITSAYGLTEANGFISSIASADHYLFAGKSYPYNGTDSIIETPLDTEHYKNSVYRDIVFGKRIANTDVSLVISRNNWTPNTVFTPYDDQDASLSTENFYAVVNAGAQYHLYKCLYNNNDSVSVIEPDFNAVSVTDSFYETSDGYIWKYMYSVDSTTVAKFSNHKYFPIGYNANVEQYAVSGSIDIVSVEDGGFGYNNYLGGLNKFSSSDLKLDGNVLIYNIGANTSASTVNNYYNGCYIYIKSGPAGEVGQYKKIVNYYANSTVKAIVIESAFANTISIASSYDIYPSVSVFGDGRETSTAFGRAIINAVSNSVSKIEMLSSGSGYEVATANVNVYSGVGATAATLRPILAPFGGHGSNPAAELNARSVMLSVSFANTEANTILGTNDYRTIGILKQPMFANVSVQVKSISGVFINGEEARTINPILLGTNGHLSTVTNIYTNSTIDLTKQFSNGDDILFSDGNTYMYATINAVSNSSQLTLSSNSILTSNTIKHYLPNLTTSGTVYSSNSTTLVLNSVDSQISTNDIIIGTESGVYAVANTIYISGVAKGFNTFVNAYKYSGNVNSGVFHQDEIVYQGSLSTANALLHSIVSNSVIYTTQNLGTILPNKSLIGSNSGAIAFLNIAYNPELVFRSGSILYIENISPVSRLPTQTENFKLVLNY